MKPPQRWSFRRSAAKAPSTRRRSTPSSARCRSRSNSQARRCAAMMMSGFRTNTSPMTAVAARGAPMSRPPMCLARPWSQGSRCLTAANASARNRNRFSESRTCRLKVLERRRFTTVTAMTASPKQLPHLVCGPAILTSTTYGNWHRICATPSLFRLRPYGHNTSPRD